MPFRAGKLKPDLRCNSFGGGRERGPFQKHREAENVTLLVTQRIEPASSVMGHDNDAATMPVLDSSTGAFFQIDFVSGVLQQGFTTNSGAQRL